MTTVDLTIPSPDLGLRLIIDASTDPKVRLRVATDPTVVAIVTRAVSLGPDLRRRISNRYGEHFNTYRQARSGLVHRVRRHGGPDHLTTRAVNERIHDLLDCPGAGACSPYHVCDTTHFATAVQDAVYAHLANDWLSPDERRLFNTPWAAVVGEDEP